MLWSSQPTKHGTEYTSHGNCYSSVIIDIFNTITLILRHGYGIQRLVYSDLDSALDDAERHLEQDV